MDPPYRSTTGYDGYYHQAHRHDKADSKALCEPFDSDAMWQKAAEWSNPALGNLVFVSESTGPTGLHSGEFIVFREWPYRGRMDRLYVHRRYQDLVNELNKAQAQQEKTKKRDRIDTDIITNKSLLKKTKAAAATDIVQVLKGRRDKSNKKRGQTVLQIVHESLPEASSVQQCKDMLRRLIAQGKQGPTWPERLAIGAYFSVLKKRLPVADLNIVIRGIGWDHNRLLKCKLSYEFVVKHPLAVHLISQNELIANKAIIKDALESDSSTAASTVITLEWMLKQ